MTGNSSFFSNATVHNTNGGKIFNNAGPSNVTINEGEHRNIHSPEYHESNYHPYSQDRRIYNTGGNNQMNYDSSTGYMYGDGYGPQPRRRNPGPTSNTEDPLNVPPPEPPFAQASNSSQNSGSFISRIWSYFTFIMGGGRTQTQHGR
ncbi:hypothetical protein AX16_010959 [Volvariella volvacea WC 439]|nr:hypothetical protein AX16_010959 [Volvariella volvacea WC 439]